MQCLVMILPATFLTKHSKSMFEFVSSCSSCSVFEAMLLMFKWPISNPLVLNANPIKVSHDLLF